MPLRYRLSLAGLLVAAAMVPCRAADVSKAPLPDIRQLMREVAEHQKQLEKVRENYTYSSIETIQDVDASGRVTKTETEERNNFFVNSHLIERRVKKNGQPLTGRDEEKEQERVTKLIEKAQKTPPGQFLEDQNMSISQLLDLMDVRNPRREMYHGRPTFVFDFIGRRNQKTHGLVEDASKKLQGTIWIDEADLQVAHLEVSFNDNFRIAGGLFATVQKGSNLRFDQAPVEGGLWLPTGGEANMQARLLLFKNMRQHLTERDFGFSQFHVETQQSAEAEAVSPSHH
ncbi:MAG TPA: hypothetical protein VL991_00285 [Terracidiphilus sp.]|jgi:hypothetical protein|nr:hypothetical protein [Terracidiphilus sp.]